MFSNYLLYGDDSFDFVFYLAFTVFVYIFWIYVGQTYIILIYETYASAQLFFSNAKMQLSYRIISNKKYVLILFCSRGYFSLLYIAILLLFEVKK